MHFVQKFSFRTTDDKKKIEVLPITIAGVMPEQISGEEMILSKQAKPLRETWFRNESGVQFDITCIEWKF